MSSIGEWPLWLRPAQIDIPDKVNLSSPIGLKSSVKKKRPLVYVYDLPPEFNSLLLEVSIEILMLFSSVKCFQMSCLSLLQLIWPYRDDISSWSV